MPDFEKMEIDELKAYREKIAAERWKLKQDFMAAGKALNVKLQDKRLKKDYKLLEEKRAKLQEKMGIKPEEKKVGLKKLFR